MLELLPNAGAGRVAFPGAGDAGCDPKPNGLVVVGRAPNAKDGEAVPKVDGLFGADDAAGACGNPELLPVLLFPGPPKGKPVDPDAEVGDANGNEPDVAGRGGSSFFRPKEKPVPPVLCPKPPNALLFSSGLSAALANGFDDGAEAPNANVGVVEVGGAVT